MHESEERSQPRLHKSHMALFPQDALHPAHKRIVVVEAECRNGTQRKGIAYRDSIEILQHALELVPMVAPGNRMEFEIQILMRITALMRS
jgi:hypothetical protein